METKDKVFIDTRQLAKRWCRDSGTIRKWRSRGNGPAYLKLNGKVVYDMEEIKKWEEESRVSNGTRFTES